MPTVQVEQALKNCLVLQQSLQELKAHIEHDEANIANYDGQIQGSVAAIQRLTAACQRAAESIAHPPSAATVGLTEGAVSSYTPLQASDFWQELSGDCEFNFIEYVETLFDPLSGLDGKLKTMQALEGKCREKLQEAKYQAIRLSDSSFVLRQSEELIHQGWRGAIVPAVILTSPPLSEEDTGMRRRTSKQTAKPTFL